MADPKPTRAEIAADKAKAAEVYAAAGKEVEAKPTAPKGALYIGKERTKAVCEYIAKRGAEIRAGLAPAEKPKVDVDFDESPLAQGEFGGRKGRRK